ncbi:MAG: NUDIX hydrolase [Solirubrobacteraceae bacterium]
MLVMHPQSVAIVALDDALVVAVRQPRPGAPEPTVELPAGGIEAGEAPLEAAIRELGEECSLGAGQWRSLGDFWVVPAYSTERVHVFEARGLTPVDGRPDPDEQIEVRRLQLAELPGALSDATSIAAFALWARTSDAMPTGGQHGPRR